MQHIRNVQKTVRFGYGEPISHATPNGAVPVFYTGGYMPVAGSIPPACTNTSESKLGEALAGLLNQANSNGFVWQEHCSPPFPRRV